ncbi:hypothetical protein N7450_007682 [Penicillium hetheringtonii]|uniref:Uncharacterized protein n=1 Tax=Penicillium hetheringtonii TaxID=911720 RepID=A0AAD6DEN3_9EURO|nr:hypothetical protein N7450_007682 [Penicillium hetheringtonii]
MASNNGETILTVTDLSIKVPPSQLQFGSHVNQLFFLAKSSIACKLVLLVRGNDENGIAVIDCGGAVTVVGTEAVFKEHMKEHRDRFY